MRMLVILLVVALSYVLAQQLNNDEPLQVDVLEKSNWTSSYRLASLCF